MSHQLPITIKNIMVATDFSESSRATLSYVEALAAHHGSEIHVVYVTGSGLFPLLPPAEREKAIGEAEAKMRSFLEGSKAASGWKQIVRGGEPSEILRQAVSELQVDLLVLGTNGRRGLRRFVLGSVAEEIFRFLPCPVLTVGPEARGREANLPLRRILFATDFTPPSLEALPYAMGVARNQQAKLTLIHVARSSQEGEAAKARLEALASNEGAADLTTEILIETGAPAAAILTSAATIDADLIVLGVCSGGTWTRAATHAPGPVAYEVVARAPCPVLTLRSHQVEP